MIGWRHEMANQYLKLIKNSQKSRLDNQKFVHGFLPKKLDSPQARTQRAKNLRAKG